MAKLLTLLAMLFGGLCCLIGLAHILFGPSVIPGSIPGTGRVPGSGKSTCGPSSWVRSN